MKKILFVWLGLIVSMLAGCGGGGGGGGGATPQINNEFSAGSFTASSIDLGVPGTGSTQVQGNQLSYRHYLPDLTERLVTGTVAFFSNPNGTLTLASSTGVFQTITTTNNYNSDQPTGLTYTGLANFGDVRAGRGNFIVLCTPPSTHVLLSSQYTRVTDLNVLANRVIPQRVCGSVAPIATTTFSASLDATTILTGDFDTTTANEVRQMFSDQGIKYSDGQIKATLYRRNSLDFPGGDLVVVFQYSDSDGQKEILIGRAVALPLP